MWWAFFTSLVGMGLGSFHKLRQQFSAFLTTYVPILHFLCSKLHVFLTTYPPLSTNVICESSLNCSRGVASAPHLGPSAPLAPTAPTTKFDGRRVATKGDSLDYTVQTRLTYLGTFLKRQDNARVLLLICTYKTGLRHVKFVSMYIYRQSHNYMHT